jgi:nitrogen fixation protein FixH
MRTWLAMTNQQFNATAAEQAAFNPVELIDRTQIERMLLKCRITDHGSRITDLTSMSFLSIVFNS